jgi:hypothetical protein
MRQGARGYRPFGKKKYGFLENGAIKMVKWKTPEVSGVFSLFFPFCYCPENASYSFGRTHANNPNRHPIPPIFE